MSVTKTQWLTTGIITLLFLAIPILYSTAL